MAPTALRSTRRGRQAATSPCRRTPGRVAGRERLRSV